MVIDSDGSTYFQFRSITLLSSSYYTLIIEVKACGSIDPVLLLSDANRHRNSRTPRKLPVRRNSLELATSLGITAGGRIC